MVPFTPVAFRSAVYPPIARRPATYQLAQTFDSLFGWSSASGDAIRLVFHGATAALGYHVWIADKSWWRYFGLVLGIGQSVGAICDLISLYQRATGTHPPAPLTTKEGSP